MGLPHLNLLRLWAVVYASDGKFVRRWSFSGVLRVRRILRPCLRPPVRSKLCVGKYWNRMIGFQIGVEFHRLHFYQLARNWDLREVVPLKPFRSFGALSFYFSVSPHTHKRSYDDELGRSPLPLCDRRRRRRTPNVRNGPESNVLTHATDFRARLY